jgi:hypothetical protein
VVFDDDGDAGTNGTQAHVLRPVLIAELTWAKLYTKAMHKALDVISKAIRKRQPTTSGPEMKKNAEKLRDQLRDANRTVGELRDQAGIRPAPDKSAQI